MNRYQSLKPLNSDGLNPKNWQAHTEDLFQTYSSYLECGDPFILQIGLGHAEPVAAIHRLYHECKRHPSPNRLPWRMTFYLIEPSPLSVTALKQVISQIDQSGEYLWAKHLEPFTSLWPILSPGLHRVKLPGIDLELLFWFGSVLEGLRQLDGHAGFARANTELISSKSELHALVNACETGASLLLPNLNESLVEVTRHAGLVCTSAGRYRNGKRVYSRVAKPRQSLAKVAVVGAGIAGSSIAKSLCQAGVSVTLFEAENASAMGASGNPVGSFHPHITRDHTPLSQLTNLGCEHSIQALSELTAQGFLTKGVDWDVPGHLQTIEQDKQEYVLDSLDRLDPHPGWVRWQKQGEAFDSAPAGLWFEIGAWVKPKKWVEANLKACGELLSVRYSEPLKVIPQGFDAVVIACAQHSLDLATAPGYRANQVKGQVTWFEKQQGLPCVLSGQSYAIDANEDWILLGATYERPVTHLEPTDQADQENLTKFRSAYPDWPIGRQVNNRCAVRSVWPDRLPAVGPVEGLDNVFLCTGFASRGLTWTEMAASKLLVDMGLAGVNCKPLSLFNKLNPNRYLQSERTDKLL